MLTITVIEGEKTTILQGDEGANLRQLLLQHGFTPYTRVTQHVNCGGRGLCATCGVWLETPRIEPTHWHDKLADGFGYPRLSCQITVQQDMTIKLVDEKWVWGERDSKRAMWFTRPAAL